MKVWLGNKAAKSSGGMYRVFDGLYNYLPKHNVEIVDKKEDADVIHAHIGLWGYIPGDKPLVVSSHGMLWEDSNWGRISDKVNKECLEAYRRADVVTAPSNFVARSIARYTGATPFVVSHGVDTDLWVPQKDRKNYVLWNKARADAASDPSEMNKLAELAPDTVFYATHGKEKENVYIFGNVAPDDMRDVVANAGVYLALSRESGGPCFGVLEAMASGVCVLSWDFGGTAESVVHQETGYLAEPYNYEDLLAGLHYCQEHNKRLSDNARQYAIDNYQWDNVITGYIDAYQAALDGYNDLVSVVIPCHNLGQFLPYCLDSVLEQTYPNIEIIVVDDASTDSSWETIKEYVKKDERITAVKNNTNRHVSFSRNRGVELSRGNYILPLDADDRLYPNAVELLVNAIQNEREYDIIAGKLHIYHESALDGPYQVGAWPNDTELKKQLEGHDRLPYCSLYKRKVWQRVGGYRTRIRNGTEDADFWTRALSLGYKAKIINEYTLKYTHRDSSLKNANAKGSVVWTSWFPWDETNAPAVTTSVKSFNPPEVSVIIPVGPGHAHYLQACIDSLIAQLEDNWEAVVINDTGEKWSTNLAGMGFIRFIDSDKNRGVAYARNRGIQAALADKIIFLDVDDTLQPHAIKALLAAHAYAGGWIYGDWYIFDGKSVEYSEAKDWDYDEIINQSLGPITGIYEKKHLVEVGGFTEDLPGWEDWDLHLKLLHIGVCGTRLNTPLITYNMHLGWRREDNFAKRKDLLKYIQKTHYSVLKDKKSMACSSCGGKRTLTISQKAQKEATTMDDLVLLEFQGDTIRRQRVKSKVQRGAEYTFSANRKRIHVFKGDAEYLLSKRLPGNKEMFKVIAEVKPQANAEIIVKEEPLVSQDIPVEFPVPIEELELEEHVVEKLRDNGIMHIADIKDKTQLMSIKGIGNQRADEIMEAVTKWLSTS